MRHGRADAIALARSSRVVLAARGKKLVRFDMTADPPDDNDLAAHILGPTGNLKAPTIRVGDTLLVTRVVRVIKDPATGKPLRSVEDKVGQLTITSVDATSAVGMFSGSGKPKTGDTVKTPPAQ